MIRVTDTIRLDGIGWYRGEVAPGANESWMEIRIEMEMEWVWGRSGKPADARAET